MEEIIKISDQMDAIVRAIMNAGIGTPEGEFLRVQWEALRLILKRRINELRIQTEK